MTQAVVVVGAGGMGRCVLDVIDAINAAAGSSRLEVVGVVDDGAADLELLTRRGVAFLGTVDAVEDLPSDVGYTIGIGSPSSRRAIDERLRASGRRSPVLAHPNAHLGFDVELGEGAVICSHVSLENHIRVGRHVHVNQNSTIGHDTVIGDWVTVSPLVAVSGSVTLADGAFLGTGASLRQGVCVGEGATVGMGSVVLDDVRAQTTVVGVPARANR